MSLHKKFEFTNEVRKVDQRVLSMSMKERRDYELEMYTRLKDNKERVNLSDGSAIYFLVDGPWISQWKSFILTGS